MQTFNFVIPSLGEQGFASDIIGHAANQVNQDSVVPLLIGDLGTLNQNLVSEVGAANTYDLGTIKTASSQAYAATTPIIDNTEDALTAVGERLSSISQEDANTAQYMAQNATVSSGGK